MLQDLVERPGERSPGELHEAYLASLRESLESLGVDAVAEASDVEREPLEHLADGDAVELTLEEAAGIVAADAEASADAVAAEARDHLLLGMTSAVLDVDTIAANVEGMDGTSVQQRIEGRMGMLLEEFASLQAFIDGETP